MLYIKDNLVYKNVIVNKTEREFWTIGVNVLINKVYVFLFVVYRSPNGSSAKFFQFLNDFSERRIDVSKKIIMFGDLNFNWDRQNEFYVRKLNDWMKEMGFKQMVKDMTRVTDTSSSIIDLVFTNMDELVCSVSDQPKIADHSNIIISLGSIIGMKDFEERQIVQRQYLDFEVMNDLLEKCVWKDGSHDVNEIWNDMFSKISDARNKSLKTKKFISNRELKPWFTKEVKAALFQKSNKYNKFKIIKATDESLGLKAWCEYKKSRNAAVAILRNAKKEWYERNIDRVQHDPTRMWKTLKTLISGKTSQATNELEIDGVVYNNKESMVNRLNEYFINSVKDIVNSIQGGSQIINDCVPTGSYKYKFEKFKNISMKDLNEIIRGLKSVSSMDGLTVEIIIQTWNHIGPCLLNIMNVSLETGSVPDAWKVATVVPVPKVPGTLRASEMRPINMLPVVEKILEQIVVTQLKEFVVANECLTDEQSGFRERHSTETAIQLVVSRWMEEIDSGNKVVAAVFLDFKRAFETIDRDRLLIKLGRLGISHTVLSWFECYLNNRRQNVRINERVSSDLIIPHGVPQGSKLGPLLFILYINDLVKVVKNCKIHMFADDTLVYIVGNDARVMSERLCEELNEINDWLCVNKMKINLSKTKMMWLNGKGIMNEVRMDGRVIDVVDNIKYLGVYIDSKLDFKLHCNYIIKKMARKVGVLCRLRSILSVRAKVIIYNAIVRPHIVYCATVLNMLSGSEIAKLQMLQNRAMRAILRTNRFRSIKSMLEELEWLNVRDELTVSILVFIYKLDKGMLPTYFNSYVVRGKDVHSYSTRIKDNLVISKFKKSKTARGVFRKGVLLYNALPERVRGSRTVDAFLRALRKHLCGNP